MLMKKISIIATLIVLVASMAAAQEVSTSKVKLHLNNGSIIYANLIDYIPDEMIKIQMENGRIVDLKAPQVKKMIMLGHQDEPMSLYHFPKKKYVHTTRIGVTPGTSNVGAGASYSLLRQIKPNLLVGVGLGVENFYASRGYNVYPLFVEGKKYLTNSIGSPFISIRFGGSLAFKEAEVGQIDASGGIYFNPVFGYRFGSNDLMFELFAGVKMQKMDYHRYINNGTSQLDILVRRLDFGLGMAF